MFAFHKRILVVVALLSAPLVVKVVTRPAAQQSAIAGPHEEIPQPPGWVPFSADGAINNGERGLHLVGRHYRASDGSERWEQGAPDPEYISIRSISKATFYEWHRESGKWTSYPMQLPDGEWQPTRYAVGRAGLTGTERLVEGITVLQQIDAGGREVWLAPSLNFFAVEVVKSPVSGTLQRYSNFDMSEPPSHLFQPPEDAAVTRSNTPRGITTSPN